jgi:hypothetical protein
MMPTKDQFSRLLHSPKFNLYLLYNLPAAFFSGVRIKEFSEKKCSTIVPYKWFTKNPFQSTYFASLAMAAEMSTGVLALSNIYKRKPALSMLLIKMEASYFKKATGVTIFSCDEGTEISKTINDAAEQKTPKIITVRSTGENKNGDLVAEFNFTWSFKAK